MRTAIAETSSQLGSALPIELLYGSSALVLVVLLVLALCATFRLRSPALADDVADVELITHVRVLARDDWGFHGWIDREGMQ